MNDNSSYLSAIPNMSIPILDITGVEVAPMRPIPDKLSVSPRRTRPLQAGLTVVALLIIAAFEGGCEIMPYTAVYTETYRYGPAVTPVMGKNEARRDLMEYLKLCNVNLPSVTSTGFTTYCYNIQSEDFEIKPFRFDEIQSLSVGLGRFNVSSYRVGFDQYFFDVIGITEVSEAQARYVVDAIFTLKYYEELESAAVEAANFARFSQDAAAWSQLEVKPPLNAQAEQYRIMAEDAFNNKEFEKAADYYEKALNVDPLWSQGQFNAAIIYGELQDYGLAALHMKRYLTLAPDAPNAAAAREKMVLWAGKAAETRGN